VNFTDDNNFAIGMGTNDDKPALFRAYRLDPQKGELHPTSNTSMVQTHHTTAMAVSNDGEYILTGCTGLGIIVWRIEGKSVLAEGVFASHASPITAVSVVPGRLQAVSADEAGTVRLWDLSDQTEVARIVPDSVATCLSASQNQ